MCHVVESCKYFSSMRCAARRYATFKHETPGGLGNVNIGKPVSFDGYAHVFFFCFFLLHLVFVYNDNSLDW